jgi:hypothetical protein
LCNTRDDEICPANFLAKHVYDNTLIKDELNHIPSLRGGTFDLRACQWQTTLVLLAPHVNLPKSSYLHRDSANAIGKNKIYI